MGIMSKTPYVRVPVPALPRGVNAMTINDLGTQVPTQQGDRGPADTKPRPKTRPGWGASGGTMLGFKGDILPPSGLQKPKTRK